MSDFDRITLLNGLALYRSLTEQEHYKTSIIPSVVSVVPAVYDLPDLIAALSSRQIFVVGMVDATGQRIGATESERWFGIA